MISMGIMKNIIGFLGKIRNFMGIVHKKSSMNEIRTYDWNMTVKMVVSACQKWDLKINTRVHL